MEWQSILCIEECVRVLDSYYRSRPVVLLGGQQTWKAPADEAPSVAFYYGS